MDMRGRFGDFGFTSIFAFSFSLNGLEKSMGTEHLDEPTILISKRTGVRVIGCDTGQCYPAVSERCRCRGKARAGPGSCPLGLAGVLNCSSPHVAPIHTSNPNT